MSIPASSVGHNHSCPHHGGGPVLAGSPDVFLARRAACRVGDPLRCDPGTDTAAGGSSTVFINSRPACRIGDPTSHGGQLVEGLSDTQFG